MSSTSMRVPRFENRLCVNCTIVIDSTLMRLFGAVENPLQEAVRAQKYDVAPLLCLS